MRSLWAGVVAQALADIEAAPIGSVIYQEAVSFFTGAFEWIGSRRDIADAIDVQVTDLERAGRHAIRARRLREGLPVEPEPERVATVRWAVRHLAAVPRPPTPEPPAPPPDPSSRGKKWAVNPFNPLLRAQSQRLP